MKFIVQGEDVYLDGVLLPLNTVFECNDLCKISRPHKVERIDGGESDLKETIKLKNRKVKR